MKQFFVWLVIIILLLLSSVGVYHFSERAKLSLNEKKIEVKKMEMGGNNWGDCISILASTTLTEAHSNWKDVSGAKKLSFQFRRDDHTAGSTEFAVYTSPVNATNTQYSEDIDIDTDVSDLYERLVANSTTDNLDGTETRVSSVTLSATGIEQYFIDQGDMLQYVVASMNTETDGYGEVYLCTQY